jgi:CRISPR system Cascade subunit CasE
LFAHAAFASANLCAKNSVAAAAARQTTNCGELVNVYFSVIMAAPGRETDAAQEWAGGPFAEHDWLWKCLGGAPEIAPDFLFRRWDIHAMPRIFSLTVEKPLPLSAIWQVTSREYAPRLATGARLQFHLRANPTVNETRDKRSQPSDWVTRKGRSQRQDVVTREKLRLLAEHRFGSWEEWQSEDKPSLQTLVHETCCEWLRGRAARHGFEVHEESFRAEHYTQHEQDDSRTQLTRQRGESGVPFSTVDLRGELAVVDPVTFAFALQRGIGRAKPLGCGMLLLDEELNRSRT